MSVLDTSRLQEPQDLLAWCEKNGFDLIALEVDGAIEVRLPAKDDRQVFHRWTFTGGEDHCDLPSARGETVQEALVEFAQHYSRKELDLERRVETSWFFGLLKGSRFESLGSIRVPPLTYRSLS